MKKSTLLIVQIIEGILLLAGFVLNMKGIGSDGTVQFAFNIIAVMFALFYLIVGYKKEGYIYYKLFGGFLALKEAAALISIVFFEEAPTLAVILTAVNFIMLMVLVFKKDLGKVKTYVFVTVVLLSSLFSLIYVLSVSTYTYIAVHNATRLLLSTVLGIMAYAKYEDKKTRGSH